MTTIRVERWRRDGRDVRELKIFSDDNVSTLLVKIALEFKEESTPYIWNKRHSLAFSIKETAWAGYNPNPFEATPLAPGQTILPPQKKDFHLTTLIANADIGKHIFAAFPSDLPDERIHSHYFVVGPESLPARSAVSREADALAALWQLGAQMPDSLAKSESFITRTTFRAPLPAEVSVESLYGKLRATAQVPFIQYIANVVPAQVLYKVYERHQIRSQYLNLWMGPNTLPVSTKAVPLIRMYSPISGFPLSYAEVAVDFALKEIRVVYRISSQERITEKQATEHFRDIVAKYLMSYLQAKPAFRQTDIHTKQQFVLGGLNIQRFAREVASIRPIFDIVRNTKKSLLLMANRASNSATSDIVEYVASKFQLGYSVLDIAEELAHYEDKKEDIDSIIERARVLAINPTTEHKAARKIKTGLSVELADSKGVGISATIERATTPTDLRRTLYWLRCMAIKAAASAAVVPPARPAAPAAPAPPVRPAAPTAQAGPSAPAQEKQQSSSESRSHSHSRSSPELESEDLDFLRSGGAGKHLLDKLQEADPALFPKGDKGYSKQCQAHKQPIVITAEEKAAMDAEGYQKSYTDAISYGSDKNRQHIYMCPRIWCPSSRRPLTANQYAERGCPNGEEALMLYQDNYWKNDPNLPRHINFFKKPTEKGLCMPCCGKKPLAQDFKEKCDAAMQGKQASQPAQPSQPSQPPQPPQQPSSSKPSSSSQTTTKSTENTNLLNLRGALDQGRYGTVPSNIHAMLIPDLAYETCRVSIGRNECAVRKGVRDPVGSLDPFMSALLYCLDFSQDLKAFLKDLRDRLGPAEFMALENGAVLQAFLPADTVYPEDVSRAEMARFIATWKKCGKSYIRHFKLADVMATAEGTRNEAADRIKLSRELAIFRAREAFFAYLSANDEPKNPYLFYDIVRLYGSILLLWERTTDGDSATLRCPFFQAADDLMVRIDKDPNVIMILQDGTSYEPIELKRSSTAGVHRMSRERVGSALLKDVWPQCPANPRADSKVYFPLLQKLMALVNVVPEITVLPDNYQITQAILSPNLRVTHLLTANGIVIIIPNGGFPLRFLSVLRHAFGTIKTVSHHEDLDTALAVKKIQMITVDYQAFEKKLQDLGLGYEFGVQEPTTVEGTVSFLRTMPPPDPSVVPIITAASRAGQALRQQPIAEEGKRKTIQELEKNVAKQLLLHYETLVLPLEDKPRSVQVATLMRSFPDIRRTHPERLREVIESAPIGNKDALRLWEAGIGREQRLPFHDPVVRPPHRGQWTFSQAALEYPLPEALRRPLRNGAPHPAPILPKKETQLLQQTVPAVAPAAPAALPQLITNVQSKSFPVKWTEIKAYQWGKFKILKSIDQTRDTIPDFFKWLAASQTPPYPLDWHDVEVSVFSYVSNALANDEHTETLMDDPSMRLAFLTKMARSIKSTKAETLKFLRRKSVSDRQELWRQIFLTPALKDLLWPADWMFEKIAQIMNINILILLERKRRTEEQIVRGSLDDLGASSLFYSGTNPISERPLVILFKEVEDTHCVYSLIQSPKKEPFFSFTMDAPKDITDLIHHHLESERGSDE